MSHGHISHRKAFRSVVFVPRRRSRRPVGRLPDDVAPAAADDMAQFRSERGFALPTTIFLVTFLTVLLATALARARSDHEVANSGQSVVDALAIAESGLQTYMDGQTSRPSDGDSVRINLTGGYADVVAHATWLKNRTRCSLLERSRHRMPYTIGATGPRLRLAKQARCGLVHGA